MKPTKKPKSFKARLRTVCGCERDVAIYTIVPNIVIPLRRPAYLLTCEAGFDSTVQFSSRCFRLEDKLKGNIYLYVEHLES